MPVYDVLVTARDKPLLIAGLAEVREKFGDEGSVAGAFTNFGLTVFTVLPDCVKWTPSFAEVPVRNRMPPAPLAKARLLLILIPVQGVDNDSTNLIPFAWREDPAAAFS